MFNTNGDFVLSNARKAVLKTVLELSCHTADGSPCLRQEMPKVVLQLSLYPHTAHERARKGLQQQPRKSHLPVTLLSRHGTSPQPPLSPWVTLKGSSSLCAPRNTGEHLYIKLVYIQRSTPLDTSQHHTNRLSRFKHCLPPQ